MMHCPLCGHTAHTRSSRYLTEKTKERYHQCRNIDCSCTFATHETVARLIVRPQLVAKKSPERRGRARAFIMGCHFCTPAQTDIKKCSR